MGAKMHGGPAQAGGGGGAPNVPAWMKTGEASSQAYQKEAQEAAERSNTPFRFYLDPKGGMDADVTFIDLGEIKQTEEGPVFANAPTFKEHTVQIGPKRWDNFVCTLPTEGWCPLCEAGSFATWVTVWRVIDHRTFKGTKGTYTDGVKLLVAKRRTVSQLLKLASKLGGSKHGFVGLNGLRFSVSRSDGNAARVGDSYIPDVDVDRASMEDLAGAYDKDGKKGILKAFDFEAAIVYKTAEELVAAGLGMAPNTSGQSGNGGANAPQTPAGMGQQGAADDDEDEDSIPF